MAYKFQSGATILTGSITGSSTLTAGDIYNRGDAEGNTYLDWSEDALGVVTGGTLVLAVSSSVMSSSLNLSASAFYGDGSNLTGMSEMTNIQAPFVSGSANTYIQQISGSGNQNVAGNNFASGVRLTMDSQFTTDGHTTGSTGWNSPVSLTMAITASSDTTGSYDITATNTDGLLYTLTDGVVITSGEEISLDALEDFSEVVNESMIGTGIRSTGADWAWSNGSISTAQITSGIEAYIEVKIPYTADGNKLTFVGLGYLDEADTSTSTSYAWPRWAVYGNAVTDVRAYSQGTSLEIFTEEEFELNSTWRVYVLNNVVSMRVKYDGEDEFETVYTWAAEVDIAANSNLVAGFTFGSTYANFGTYLDDIKLYGVLTNEP